MYFAIQKGFNKSTGEIMAWINSDDIYNPGTFRIVADIFTTLHNIEWLNGMPCTYNEEGLCVKIGPCIRW
jgi:hypothetical protein